jgi:hypothetical protein
MEGFRKSNADARGWGSKLSHHVIRGAWMAVAFASHAKTLTALRSRVELFNPPRSNPRNCCTSSPFCNKGAQAEMALVDYSSSEDEDEDGREGKEVMQEPSPTVVRKPPLAKGKRPIRNPEELPPLPASFHDLYATNVRASTSDDPSLHGGRKRHVPHVEGNWPTHVYLECKSRSHLPRY